MNITVISLKDILKYMIGFILILTIIVVVVIGLKGKEGFEEKEEKDNLFDKIKNSSFLYCLKTELPMISSTEDSKNISDFIADSPEKIINTQLAMMYNLEEDDENWTEGEVVAESDKKEEVVEEVIEDIEEPQNDKASETPQNAETEVISENNIKASFTDSNNNIQINNQTKYDIKDILENSNYEISNKNKFIIYHTHTCESYTSSEKYKYEMTGAYRTTDLNYTVSRVGDELEKYLKEYGKIVVHDKTYHDYPAYNGSYNRSLKTMEKVLQDNKDAEITIDLHRDAVGSSNTYGPTVKIGDEVCAQVMFVIGSDGSGLYHPNWRKNLQFAIKVQQTANEMYPGLFRPIILRNSRYNQHLTTATTIIEVGATGNSLEQCLSSMKYLAKVFDEVTK